MPKIFCDKMSELLREVEVDLGPTELSILALEALYDALTCLKAKDLHDFYTQLKSLTDDIENTQPRYAIITDSFIELLRMVYKEDHNHEEEHCAIPKEKFLKCLKRLIKEKKQVRRKIVKQSEQISIKGKTILVYNHSVTLEHVLKRALNRNQKFNVIVAEQDLEKTGAIIEFLFKSNIPYKVVPSYMVSHLSEDIDALFFGALTLKSNMNFVMDTGANAIIAQFHLLKKPIYVFMSTVKFSLWKSEVKDEVFTNTHQRSHHAKDINFERIKFSHDRVSHKLISKVVTEEGIFTPDKIEEVFNKKLEERLRFEKKMDAMC